jgi:hypothetical protein
MDLSFIHARLATSLLVFAALAGIWGLIGALRRRRVDSSYWGILAIGQLLFMVQAALGVILWIAGDRPGRTIHMLYGIVALLTLPAYFTYSKGQDTPRARLVYGMICLVLAAIAARATATGAG